MAKLATSLGADTPDPEKASPVARGGKVGVTAEDSVRDSFPPRDSLRRIHQWIPMNRNQLPLGFRDEIFL